MYLELRHLRTLRAIREQQSLAGAAERLHLTQSALSHQVKALEEYFGVDLFVRKSRPLRFTHAGQRLLDLADRVLPDVESTERELARIREGERGRLHIAIECHSCFEWLMPTMDAYRVEWPEVEMDLSMGFSFAPLAALKRGDVDLVVTSDPVSDEALRFEPLFRYQNLLAMAAEHPLAERPWVEPADLAGETLITYPVERERLDVFTRFLEPAGVEPREVRHSELTVMILQLVASGRGVAVLPNWALADYLDRDYVAARPLGEAGLWSTLYAGVRAGEAGQAYLQGFLEAARRTSFEHLRGIEPAG